MERDPRSSVSPLRYVTNNLNQANNLMLWWTLEHGAITICWGGLFYNWGENSNSSHPTTCHQSAEVKCLNFPRETAWWQLNEGQDDGGLCVIEFLLQTRPTLSHRPTRSDLVKFPYLIDWNWEQAQSFKTHLRAVFFLLRYLCSHYS